MPSTFAPRTSAALRMLGAWLLAAAATRAKVFDMLATDKLAFLGYHMPFPAVGFVEKVDQGYRFVPKAYQFDI